MISIIVPIYKVKEEFLRKCIESIIAQTYNNIEILLIEDGSPDDSGKIINEYSKIDNRIKAIHKENSGVSATRNIGINLAQGEWIMFVDADDWLEKNACDKLLEHIEKDADIVVAKTFIEYPDKTEVYNNYYNQNMILNSYYEKKEMMESIFLNRFTKYQRTDTPWAKLYRKEFLIKNKLIFKENLKMGEDGFLNFESYYKANKIKYLNEEVYHYRINQESVCNTFNGHIIDTYNNLFDYYEKLLKNIDLDFSKQYNYFLFRQLKNFLKKYFFSKDNLKSYEDLKLEFNNLVTSERYSNALMELDTNYLSIKDKILLNLIRNKEYYLLKLIYHRK